MGHNLAAVYDRIVDWDCDFTFSREEIDKWRHEHFYLFLYGQHCLQGKHNTRYNADTWMQSKYYKVGKARAYTINKAKNNRSAKPYDLRVRVPKSRAVTRQKTFKIFYDGILYNLIGPDTQRKKFIPEVGMNLTVDAQGQYYYYYLRQSKYIFVYSNSPLRPPIDVTNILYGRGEWPSSLRHITFCFDGPRILEECIREYHFINFIIKNRRVSYATYADWLEFRFLVETSPGSIY